MIKILIADDHPIVRKGLKEIIEETPGMKVVDEASNGQEVLEKVFKKDINVVLLDISMPGRSGLDILRDMKRQKPKLVVLVLSMHPEEQYAVQALKEGASGYLTKKSAPDELLTALRKVSSGGKYVSSSLAEKLAYALEKDGEKPPHETLSVREYEVMRMIASGKTVTEIARELFLSPKTISTYRARILEKMRMKNNAQLVRYAIKNRLVD
ncbi:MAG: response regulator transcription factor [Candidatus Aminicenantes bacterium]|nr:response regulator transcription factor [Candidatus Aminicenantes bacterium]